MHFIERRYSHDETNWWVPNRACTEAMLRSSGFVIEQQPEEEVYVCRRRELADGAGWVRTAFIRLAKASRRLMLSENGEEREASDPSPACCNCAA